MGLLPGLVVMFFIFNMKGVSCSGYLPNSRVIKETQSKKAVYLPDFEKGLATAQITRTDFEQKLFPNGDIDFRRSLTQAVPCPMYYMTVDYGGKKHLLRFTKCETVATFESFE